MTPDALVAVDVVAFPASSRIKRPKRATTKPRPMMAMLVRLQASRVRSLAR